MPSYGRSRTVGHDGKAIDESLDSISDVAQQMLPISNLNNAGRALTNAIGVNTSSIACDNLNAWMSTQPIGN